MAARTSSPSSVLVIVLLVITFPVWIGLAGGLFGLVVGLLGAIFGVLGALFGAIFGVFDWGFHGFSFPVFSISKILLAIAIVFFIVLLSRNQKKATK